MMGTQVVLDTQVYRYLVKDLEITDNNIVGKSMLIKYALAKLGKTYASLDVFYELLKHWKDKNITQEIQLAIKLYILLCSEMVTMSNDKASFTFDENILLPSYLGLVDRIVNVNNPSKTNEIDEWLVDNIKKIVDNLNNFNALNIDEEFISRLNKISNYCKFRLQLTPSIIYNFYIPRRNKKDFDGIDIELYRSEIMKVILSSVNNNNEKSFKLNTGFVSEYAFQHLYYLELKKITAFLNQYKVAWAELEKFELDNIPKTPWFNTERVNRYNDFYILSVVDLCLPNWKIISNDGEMLFRKKKENPTKFDDIKKVDKGFREEHTMYYSDFLSFIKEN